MTNIPTGALLYTLNLIHGEGGEDVGKSLCVALRLFSNTFRVSPFPRNNNNLGIDQRCLYRER